MARRGFFGRIVDRIRQVVAPSPPPQRPPPERPPPERGAPPREREITREYRREWRDQRPKGSFGKNLDVFERMMDDVDMPEDERPELWESYIRHIVKGEGRFRRNSTSNMFWRDSGIDPASMNWAQWRLANGYTGRNRSRTA